MLSLFQELKWRNLIKDCSDEKKMEELLISEKINFYCGFDPTANSLTLGHLIQINAIFLFLKHHHCPFVLIGGGTGLIGDPKETKERLLLSQEEIFNNSLSIKKQLKKIFSNTKIKFIDNYIWISKMDFIYFFRFYGKLFNVNYMISKEIVSKRLKTGISYTEFSYMILQALDFYKLYKDFDVILQFGGSDQWGNITSGLELIRKMEFSKNNKKKPLGFSIPLLLDNKGVKFGKSEGNALWLDNKLSSSYQIYQYLLNIDDNNVIDYLKKMTLLDYETINFLEQKTKSNPKERIAQKRLAESIVIFLHGNKELQKCIRINNILFNKNLKKWSLTDLIFLSKKLNFVKTNKNISLVDVLVQTKLALSKNEARRFILANSIKIFGNYIKKVDFVLEQKKALYNKYFVITKKNKINVLVIFD
ncbi:tyrosine--tRNA ligase [Candidatus Phytoplasma sacchari]|uniref:Tyrosine--tRNA ligase n=1 Tax=Candidatus Phytoplasma sacchari TaxID=2609813 RepID=A0ABY7M3H6_9MOLU|nr:tyrosine--tRNA ligase [Candidatus Phytoplasma sacchari]